MNEPRGDEDETERRPAKRAVALGILVAGIAALTAAPSLGGWLTLVAAAVGLVLVVVGAALGPRRR